MNRSTDSITPLSQKVKLETASNRDCHYLFEKVLSKE